MPIRHILHQATAVLALAVLPSAASAQVYIPSEVEREWLNDHIPGIVDASGVMDTLHPGIAGLTEFLKFAYLQEVPDTLHVHGLAYLDSLWKFDLRVQTFSMDPMCIKVHGVPAGLTDLRLHAESQTSFDLPELPAHLDQLRVSCFSDPGLPMPHTLTIAAGPASIGDLWLAGLQTVDLGGVPQVGRLMLKDPHDLAGSPNGWHQGFIAPPMSADQVVMALEGYSYDPGVFDLSAVAAPRVRLGAGNLYGTILWPTEMVSLLVNEAYGTYSLGPFPSTLDSLEITDLVSQVQCLPHLPDTMAFLIVDTSLPCLPNWPQGPDLPNGIAQWATPEEAVYCSVLNSTCPGGYPGIAGRVFVDTDGNGQYDTDEPGLPQANVTVMPAGNVTGVLADGTWEIGVYPGSHTITAATNYPYVQAIAPAEHTADVPAMGDTDTDNDFAVTLMPGIADLRAQLYAQEARPGYENRLFLTCTNYGTVPMNATLTLDFDAGQSWVGSSITPTTLAGQTATWDLGTMPFAAVTQMTVDLYTDATVPLGTPLLHTLTAMPVEGDETPDDNIVLWNDTVVGSYDPNDKLISPATLTPAEVAAGQTPIEYTVRFQNTGTYLAERVVILDTLPDGLVPESIQFLASSHDNHWYVTDGVLHVVHEDIMLPDSTSDEPGSHGYVMFRIMPRTDLMEGEQVHNIAHIVFDFNEPIITPPAVFTVSTPTGVGDVATAPIGIHPNPVRDRLWVSGVDGPVPYRVRDVHGRTVQQGTLAQGAVDVAALPAGMYVIAVEGLAPALRFVKER